MDGLMQTCQGAEIGGVPLFFGCFCLESIILFKFFKLWIKLIVKLQEVQVMTL